MVAKTLFIFISAPHVRTAYWKPVTSQLGPSTRVVETGLKIQYRIIPARTHRTSGPRFLPRRTWSYSPAIVRYLSQFPSVSGPFPRRQPSTPSYFSVQTPRHKILFLAINSLSSLSHKCKCKNAVYAHPNSKLTH